jgi:hypothetical protein
MVKRATPPPWWEHEWVRHPMDDDAFTQAFVTYVMCHSDDHTLRKMRERASFFVRTILRQELEASRAAYRAEHPLDA